MPLNTQEILELITIICEKRNVQVCVTQSLRGAAITAAGALFGSLIMGPLGLVMGAVGGSLGAISTGENYRPLPQILMNDITHAQREEITTRINRVIADLDVTDLRTVMMLAMSQSVSDVVIRELGCYVQRELSLALKHN
ncbi:protein C19orf12 homolog [Nilaparvata lugens]|uniref:protein C19orf12 homolog n=1 Tax=Nilaparvata lugens TaxID=108931 RepID=UPI000B997C9B|nr:protein C19orf12 homolog [Nilaparvata lugens]XP_022193851.1 protein C19orf12 homolog [Nilaparvata lugens]XP_039289406.1 protein C19orf12 homolog [Nilaparvata lugens]